MTILDEGDLRFDFGSALSARKFDGEDHGLTHCMSAVDFIVEMPDRALFIEIKDPQHPSAQQRNIDEFVRSLQSDSLIKRKLVPKCRDSYLYELSMGRVKKPVHYVVLVALNTLSDADLGQQTDLLNKSIPVDGPPRRPWIHKFIQGCMVMNLETWRKYLPKFPVQRLSQQPDPKGT